MMADRTQLDWIHRLAAYVSWALAGAIFLTVGWLALEPVDPRGPVSLMAGRGAVLMLAQAAALAAVAAALATILVGSRLPDVGVFATAIGLTAVSLRGHTMESLLLGNLDPPAGGSGGLAWRLILESLGWFVIALVAVLVSGFVQSWLSHTRRPSSDDASSDQGSDAALALADVPIVGNRVFGIEEQAQTPFMVGIKHTAIATVAGLIAFRLFSSGLYDRNIQHGQSCFVVAAALGLGSYFAYRFAPVRSAAWDLLACGLLTIIGFIIAGVSLSRPSAAALPPNIPVSHFLRVLPIQYIAVGSATAVAMYWYLGMGGSYRDQEGSS